MEAYSIQIRNLFQAIFYVLVMAFAGFQLDVDRRINPRHDQSREMNQIPEDPLDPENEEKVWNDQDLMDKSELMTPFNQKIPRMNNFIFLFFENLMYPVWSPPPKTQLV